MPSSESSSNLLYLGCLSPRPFSLCVYVLLIPFVNGLLLCTLQSHLNLCAFILLIAKILCFYSPTYPIIIINPSISGVIISLFLSTSILAGIHSSAKCSGTLFLSDPKPAGFVCMHLHATAYVTVACLLI